MQAKPSHTLHVATDGPLGHAWSVGNVISVFQTRSSPPAADETDQQHQRVETQISTVKWATTMHDNEIMRKLALTSYKIFSEVQECNGTDKSQYVHFSLEYRAALTECARELSTVMNSLMESDEEKASHLAALYEQINACELIWYLSEILFIQASPKGRLIRELLNLFSTQCTGPMEWYENLVDPTQAGHSEEGLEERESYWKAVRGLILQGRPLEAGTLLAGHSEASCQAFVVMRGLLRSLPRCSGPGGERPSFMTEYLWGWQMEVKTRLNEGIWDQHPDLEMIANLISGDEETWFSPQLLRDLMECCEVDVRGGSSILWFYLMISWLFYTNPVVGLGELEKAANLTQTQMDNARMMLGPAERAVIDTDKNKALSHILQLIIELNPLLFFYEASQHLTSWWLVAHLTDLLHHTEPSLFAIDTGMWRQTPHEPQTNFYLRETMIPEYAMGFLSHPGLWQVALGYLDHCPTLGRHYQTLIVERIPIENDRKAHKVIQWCESRIMRDQAFTLCRILSRRHISARRLGPALVWAMRGRAASLINQVAQLCLQEYASTGTIVIADMLPCLGASSLLSEKMAFLVRFHEFHLCMTAGEMERAALLVQSLVTSSRVPRQFWFSILSDSVPLMTGSYLMTRCQIDNLMAALNDVVTDPRLVDNLPKDRLAEVQKVLSKALARAIIKESSGMMNRGGCYAESVLS